jgi:phage tail sheath protein FI
MPFNYKSPGVYVEEVAKGARPIESAATSVLAIVGLCRDTIQVEKIGQGMVSQSTPNTPTLITNWTQFINTYGDFDQAVPGSYLHDAVYGFFLNGGTSVYVVGLPVPVKEVSEVPLLPAGEATLLTAGNVPTVHITSTGPLKPGEEISVQVQPPGEGAPPETFNLVVERPGAEPKVITNLTLGRSGRGARNIAEVLTKETDGLLKAEVLEAPGSVAERLPAVGTKVTLAPMKEAPKPSVAEEIKQRVTPDFFKGSAAERTGIAGLEAVEDVTIVACPDIVAAYQWGACTEEDVKAVQTFILNHCEQMKDRFAILDCPAGMSVQDMIDWRKNRMNFDSKYGALYYPWLKVNGKLVPPSGHVAGVYARVDAERGVHKAPANEIVRGVIGLERNISRNEQDHLNPIGVNCIRAFPGQGIRIWGARTLSSDAQWRYINVRRLFCNVEESILQGTSWIVFEPNDWKLWSAIRRDVSAYLTTVWRSGALFGRTAEEAFYVKCDEETNPKELRDLGYCIIEVGIAPVKPAEFVVFRISQKEDGAGTSE